MSAAQIEATTPADKCASASLPLTKMSVSLTPSSQLGFNSKSLKLLEIYKVMEVTWSYLGPFTKVVQRILTVTNHNEQPVAFKVKTTAPKVCTFSRFVSSKHIDLTIAVNVDILCQTELRKNRGWPDCRGSRCVSRSPFVAQVLNVAYFSSTSVLLQAMREEPPLSIKCKDKFLVQSTFITPEKEALSLHDLVRTHPFIDTSIFLNYYISSGAIQKVKNLRFISRRSRWCFCHRLAKR